MQFDEHSDSNEPPSKRPRKSTEGTVVEPTQINDSSAPTVVRPTIDAFEIPKVQGEVVRAGGEEAQRLVQAEFVVIPVVPAVLPAEIPTPQIVNNLNPTLGIMGVVRAVNEET